MKKLKIMINPVCIFAPKLASGVNGISLAFSLIETELKKKKTIVYFVDSTGGRSVKKSGSFNLVHLINSIIAIFKCCFFMMKTQILYSMLSTSKLGVIRDFILINIGYLLNKKIILHLHGGGFENLFSPSSRLIKKLIYFNLKHSTNIIVLTENIKYQFRYFNTQITDKIIVIGNCLPVDITEPPATNKEIDLTRRIELLYLSSLMPSKGYLDIIQALIQMTEAERKYFHLNLCGNFIDAITECKHVIHDENTLLEYVNKLNLQKTITYYGELTGRKKIEIFKSSDVFILPTYYPWEGQPLSIIEAMAFSLPVITCKNNGISEMIINEFNGFFVKPRSPIEIKNVLLTFINKPKCYNILSKNARKQYEINYRRKKHLSKMFSLFS